MDPYPLAKFLHLATVIAAFVASGLMHSALGRLREARDAATARAAARTLGRLGPRMPLFLLALLITGGWLAQQRWSFQLPWVDIAIVGLIVMGAISGIAIKPRSQAIIAGLQNVEGPLDATMRAAVRDPALWTWAHVPAPIAAGIVFDMALKPGWAGSVLSVAVAVAIGVFVARATQSTHAAEEAA